MDKYLQLQKTNRSKNTANLVLIMGLEQCYMYIKNTQIDRS